MRQIVCVLLASVALALDLQSTAPDGTFLFEPVTAGTYRLSVTRLGGQSAISALDASYALQAAVGLRTLTDRQKIACDVSGDGTVGALDAAYMMQVAVGLRARFPIAEACGSDWVFWPEVPSPSPPNVLGVTNPHFANGSCTMGAYLLKVDGTPPPVKQYPFAGVIIGDCTGNGSPS